MLYSSLGALAVTLNGNQLLGLYRSAVPFVKVGPNDYLIGTQVKKVTVQRGQAQVKEANRYVSLLEYLHRNAQAEFILLLEKMQTTSQPLSDVVMGLLERQGAQR